MSDLLFKIHEILTLHKRPECPLYSNQVRENLYPLISSEMTHGLRHLSSIYHRHKEADNDIALINDIRDFLALRSALIKDTMLAYDRFLDQPITPMNQICIDLATMIAKPDEPIVRVLIPSLSIDNYLMIDESLMSLTEETGRVLNLRRCILSDRAVIPIVDWFDEQKTRIRNECKPYLNHLYSVGPGGTNHLITIEEFREKQNELPYKNYENYASYMDDFHNPALSKKDLARIVNAFPGLKRIVLNYVNQSVALLSSLSLDNAVNTRSEEFLRRFRFYHATIEFARQLKKHGVDHENAQADFATEEDANNAAYDFIRPYLAEHYSTLDGEMKKVVEALSCGSKTFGQYLLMFRAAYFDPKTESFGLTPEEALEQRTHGTFRCVDEASDNIMFMLKSHQAELLGVAGAADTLLVLDNLRETIRNHLDSRILDHAGSDLEQSIETRATLDNRWPKYIKFLGSVWLDSIQTISELSFLHDAVGEPLVSQLRQRRDLLPLSKLQSQIFMASEEDLLLVMKVFVQKENHGLLAVILERALELQCKTIILDVLMLVDHSIVNLENMLEYRSETLLQYAFALEKKDLFEILLRSSANRDGEFGVHKLPLLFAAVLVDINIETIQFLIESGADITGRFKDKTLLYWAIDRGITGLINLLLKREDLDVNEISLREETWPYGKASVIHLATSDHSVDLFSRLIARGAKLNVARADGSTPLHLAISLDHSAIVPLILQEKSSIFECIAHTPAIDHKDVNGFTALDLAIRGERYDFARALLSCGANPNQPSLMLYCLESQKLDAICLLADHGAGLNVANTSYETPLHLAVYKGDIDALRKMLSPPKCILDRIEVFQANNELDKVETLKKVRSSLFGTIEGVLAFDFKDQYSRTALQTAIILNNWEIVKLLIPHTSPSNSMFSQENDQTRSSVWYHIKNQPDVLRMLIEYGHDLPPVIHDDGSSHSSLAYAIEKNWQDCVDKLISKKAGDPFGQKILVTAMRFKQLETFKKLFAVINDFAFGAGSLNEIERSLLGVAVACDAGNDFYRYILEQLCQNQALLDKHFRCLFYWSDSLQDKFVFDALQEYGQQSYSAEHLSAAYLHLAMDKGDLEKVETLSRSRIDFSQITTLEGRSLLHWAITCHQSDFAMHLMQKGISLETIFDPGTHNRPLLLELIGQRNDKLIMTCLTRDDLNVNASDIYGTTALHLALTEKHPWVVSMLLNKGANPYLCNATGKSAFHLAIDNNDYPTVKYVLCVYQSNPTQYSVDDLKDVQTGLQYALTLKRIELVKLFMKYVQPLPSDDLEGSLGLASALRHTEALALVQRRMTVNTMDSSASHLQSDSHIDKKLRL